MIVINPARDKFIHLEAGIFEMKSIPVLLRWRNLSRGTVIGATILVKSFLYCVVHIAGTLIFFYGGGIKDPLRHLYIFIATGRLCLNPFYHKKYWKHLIKTI